VKQRLVESVLETDLHEGPVRAHTLNEIERLWEFGRERLLQANGNAGLHKRLRTPGMVLGVRRDDDGVEFRRGDHLSRSVEDRCRRYVQNPLRFHGSCRDLVTDGGDDLALVLDDLSVYPADSSYAVQAVAEGLGYCRLLSGPA